MANSIQQIPASLLPMQLYLHHSLCAPVQAISHLTSTPPLATCSVLSLLLLSSLSAFMFPYACMKSDRLLEILHDSTEKADTTIFADSLITGWNILSTVHTFTAHGRVLPNSLSFPSCFRIFEMKTRAPSKRIMSFSVTKSQGHSLFEWCENQKQSGLRVGFTAELTAPRHRLLKSYSRTASFTPPWLRLLDHDNWSFPVAAAACSPSSSGKLSIPNSAMRHVPPQVSQ